MFVLKGQDICWMPTYVHETVLDAENEGLISHGPLREEGKTQQQGGMACFVLVYSSLA